MHSVDVLVRTLKLLITSWTIWWIQFLPESENFGYAAQMNCGGSSTRMSTNCTLTPSQNSIVMSSPNGTFVLSFVLYNGTNSYYLAISFAVSPNTHPVWTANRDFPVSSKAKLTLDYTGNLILYDSSAGSSSSSPVWSSNTSNIGVSEAQLLEKGSLVLISSASNRTLWTSFNSPTDTLLPGQNLTLGYQLLSSSSAANLSKGPFSLSFSSDASTLLLTQTRLNYIYYNVSHLVTLGYFNFNEIGEFPNFESPNLSSDYGKTSFLRKLTLDTDGNLRLYTWDESSSEWNIVWVAMTHICNTGPNICGDYGVCVYKPQPACVCPPGMSPVSSDDITLGCSGSSMYQPSNSCDTANPRYLTLDNIDFPFSDMKTFSEISESDCKLNCWTNCSCLAAVYELDGSGNCWLKSSIKNGRAYITDRKYRTSLRYSASFNESSTNISSLASNNDTTYWSYSGLWQIYNVQKQGLINHNNIERTQRQVIIALGVVVTAMFIVFTVVMAMVVEKYRRNIHYIKLQSGLEAVSRSPIIFTYQELQHATANFALKLGAGGFGSVYKGELVNGTRVAVKKLEGLSEEHGEKQFRAEITTIGKIHHINLLRLLGFCAEHNHKLLVYDYIENGSLDKILFTDRMSKNKLVLGWQTRYQICLGVARGISYLHHDCSECIVHCDIKPQNILLDQRYSPKVADFGVAYLYSRDHTMKMTTIRGTRGYMAPEWLSHLPITTKADVYSYGMLVMEIVSGKSNFKEITELHNEDEEPDDDRWCFPVWAYGKPAQEVLDPRLLQSTELLDGIDWNQVESVMKVAYLCIQKDHHARPSMAAVVQMLEGTLSIPADQLQAPPSFLPGSGIHFFHNLSATTTTTGRGSLVSSTASTSSSILSAR